MEDEWLVFGEFLYSKGLKNSRSSFSQVGETNMEQMALGGLAKSDRSWKKQGGKIRPFRSTKSSRISLLVVLGTVRCNKIQLAAATRLEFCSLQRMITQISTQDDFRLYYFVHFEFLIILGLYFKIF